MIFFVNSLKFVSVRCLKPNLASIKNTVPKIVFRLFKPAIYSNKYSLKLHSISSIPDVSFYDIPFSGKGKLFLEF